MKCRRCGKDTMDIDVAGLGWMHFDCEILRLHGLMHENDAEIARLRAEVEETRRELMECFNVSADALAWARCFGNDSVPAGEAQRATTALAGAYYEWRHTRIDACRRERDEVRAELERYRAACAGLRPEGIKTAVACLTMGAQVNTPDFLDWIADRLVNVHGESQFVDYVHSCRDRAKAMRAALSGLEVKP